MNDELTKSLTQLIDETLQELEELKKSRFEAQEIKLHDKDDGIHGHEADGAIKKDEDEEEEEAEKGENEHALKAEDDEEDEDHDEEEDHDDEDEEEEAEKADHDDPADAPDVGRKLKGILGNRKKEKMSKEEAHKAEKEPHKDDPEHEKKEKKLARKLLDMHKGEKSPEAVEKDMEHLEMKGMKKSIMTESSELMKSLIDERVQPLEEKLSVILNLVNQIAEQPVSPRGVTARTAPLLKSADEGEYETLTKSQVASKLFELKKSGSPVDSLDVAKAEMGQDLGVIVKKYKLS